MVGRKSAPSPDADDRFNMDIPAELADQIMETLLAIDNFAKRRPLAAMRAALKMQGNLRTIEREAALFANNHYKVSWARIGEAFGKTAQWANERYVEIPRRALAAKIRLAKLSPAEVKEKPHREQGEEPED